MDHQQHSTGKGWVIIVDRIIVGLVIFQVTMAGQLALRLAFKRSVLIVPLVIMTLSFSIVYNRNYTPLMTYIALRSIKRAEHDAEPNGGSSSTQNDRGFRRRSMNFATVDETRERKLQFINPNLVKP
jgi:calcium permeable stress-gated cation channel